MAEDDGFEECLHQLLAFGVELCGGFELEAEFFVGLAFVVVEDEGVGGDGEGEGEVA